MAFPPPPSSQPAAPPWPSPSPPPTFSAVGNEYSVCHATQWDNVTADGIPAESRTVSEAHVAFSMVSAICCLFVIVASLKYPTLRKFPANMLLWKTVCDLITSCIIVGINIAMLSMGPDEDYTHGSELCANGVLAGLVRAPNRQ